MFLKNYLLKRQGDRVLPATDSLPQMGTMDRAKEARRQELHLVSHMVSRNSALELLSRHISRKLDRKYELTGT